MVNLVAVAEEMIKYEPEFKQGGFVYTHINKIKAIL